MTDTYQTHRDDMRSGRFWPNHWVAGLSLRHRLMVIAVVELAYWIATRLILHSYKWDSMEAESLRLVLRLATAGMCWWVLNDIINSRVTRAGELTKFPVLIASTLLIAAAITMPHPTLSTSFAILFGIGSIAVGLKEELLFRGVLQNLLQSRFGFANAVLITTVVFTAWHYGAVPNSRWQFSTIFLASIVLGVVYVRSGSIWAPVVLHSIFDAMFAIPTPVTHQFGVEVAFVMLATAVSVVCIGATSERASRKSSAEA